MSDIGYKEAFLNFAGPGAVVLVPEKAVDLRVHAVAITVDTACGVVLGHKAPGSGFGTAVPVTATFHVEPSGPLVLPFTEDGWFTFPAGDEIVAAALGAAADVAVQVIFARRGV